MADPFVNRVRVRVRALSPERLINTALRAGVALYDLDRESARELTLSIDAAQWPQLRRILRQLGARFRPIGRRGPFFAWRHFQPQLWLFLCLVVCGLALYGVSGCILRVEVEPRDGVDPQALLALLEQQGVHVGMRPDGAQLRQIESQVLAACPDYTYLALDRRGMVLRVRAVAATPEPNVGRQAGTDIVAACDAVVEQIFVYRGTAMVRPGDTVVRGQVLISGAWSDTGGASGDVTGRAWFSGEGSCPLQNTVLVPTGSKIVIKRFQTPWSCVIIEGDPAGEETARVDQTHAALLDGLFLGVHLVTTRYETLTQAPQRLSEAQARSQATQAAFDAALQRLPLGTQVADTAVDARIQGGRAVARVTFTAVLPIGVPGGR